MLSLAMRSSQMGIWTRHLGTGAVWWSRELEELVGLEEGGFAGTQAGFHGLVHRQDVSALEAAVAGAIESHRDYTVEFRFLHRSGQWRWMEGRGRAIYDPVRQAHDALRAGHRHHRAQEHRVRDAAPGGDLRAPDRCDRSSPISRAGSSISTRPPRACSATRWPKCWASRFPSFTRPSEAERVLRQSTERLLREGQWQRRDRVPPQGREPGDLRVGVQAADQRPGRDLRHGRHQSRRHREPQGPRATAAAQRATVRSPTGARTSSWPRSPTSCAIRWRRCATSSASCSISTTTNPPLRRSLDVLERQLQQMTHLVDDLLEISRITQGKLALRRTRFDLACGDEGRAGGGRSIRAGGRPRARPSRSPEPGVVLDADMTRIVQAILNLLNNAVKYTPPTGRIWVEGRREGDRGADLGARQRHRHRRGEPAAGVRHVRAGGAGAGEPGWRAGHRPGAGARTGGTAWRLGGRIQRGHRTAAASSSSACRSLARAAARRASLPRPSATAEPGGRVGAASPTHTRRRRQPRRGAEPGRAARDHGSRCRARPRRRRRRCDGAHVRADDDPARHRTAAGQRLRSRAPASGQSPGRRASTWWP